MGLCPIGWRDIVAWQEVTGVELEPWLARLVRQLSAAYLAEYTAAEKPDRPAPYAPDVTSDAHRAAVSDKVAAIFGRRARG